MIKKIGQEYVAKISTYMPNNIASKGIKQVPTDLNEKTNMPTIVAGDFNTLSKSNDREGDITMMAP